MVAKFAGKCDKCQAPITVGQEISWNRKRRGIVYHLNCAGNGITTTSENKTVDSKREEVIIQLRNSMNGIEYVTQDCPQCMSNADVRTVKADEVKQQSIEATHRCQDCNNYFNTKSGQIWMKNNVNGGYVEVTGEGFKTGGYVEVTGEGFKTGGYVEVTGEGFKTGGYVEVTGEGFKTEEKKTVIETKPVNGDLASVLALAIQGHLQMPFASVDASQVRAIVKEELQTNGAQPVTVQVFNAQTSTVQDLGVQHHLFPELLQILSVGLNVWLTGPAGSGKTTAAHNCAKALELEFRFCGAQSNEYGLLGFVDANGKTVRTPFREAYEHGGVFLFDEVDASAASAVLAFNAALANGVCNFPDAIVARHEKFVCIAAANTFGLGATNDYVGRMKQDAAFIDRFVALAWDIDETLETALSGNAVWSNRVQHLRKRAVDKGLKVVISPRASMYGAKLLASGMKQDRVEALTVRKGMTSAQWESIV